MTTTLFRLKLRKDRNSLEMVPTKPLGNEPMRNCKTPLLGLFVQNRNSLISSPQILNPLFAYTFRLHQTSLPRQADHRAALSKRGISIINAIIIENLLYLIAVKSGRKLFPSLAMKIKGELCAGFWQCPALQFVPELELGIASYQMIKLIPAWGSIGSVSNLATGVA